MRTASCMRLTDNRTSPRKFQTNLAAHPEKRKDSLDRNNSRVRRNPGAKQCPTVSSAQREAADLLVASKDHSLLSPCRAKYSGEPQTEARGTKETWRMQAVQQRSTWASRSFASLGAFSKSSACARGFSLQDARHRTSWSCVLDST